MTATTTRGVKCGNCKAYHPSAEAVRYCYTGKGESVMQEGPSQVNTEATADDVNAAALRILGGPARPTWKTLPDVPEGYYAIPSISGNNDLDFYKVSRPDEGKWAGFVFVKMVVGGNPDYPVKGLTKTFQVLKAIQDAGIKGSALMYGQEIGNCCRCNRHLTDETSRAFGMGPDCREIVGW